MDIIFKSRKLEKELNSEIYILKRYGTVCGKKIKLAMTALRAAPSLQTFFPPYSKPYRCHELLGDRKGQISIDAQHPYRVLFEANHNPLPTLDAGGLDWSKVTSIRILSITDTH
ncbi:TPA: killer suppression protein [Pasteurella multocida]|uniref:killer suppression protein n=1 Tax=Pasteurella multocida TaxID=747 RepID=UPI00061A7B9D|nr:killer suppression protein [Pasteurella multocida]AKD37500.1 killer suppression protein HigA [Pasteurella multocida subsp. multocida OH4807]MEB3489876.1 killer suppression protein [Pasteurella multocida]VEJ15721.1 Uncharacterised protein [Pasteurella multocida subsp. septica]HDR0611637.1 killer suppression protein [Pasteurella multocida]HDR1108761.1 killer suppression protein [Pasteurella multocida]